MKVNFYKNNVQSNPRTFEIPNQVCDLGQLEPGFTKQRVSWKYIGNGVDIVYTKPGCSCTAEIEYIGNEIIAKIEDQDVTTAGHNLTIEDRKKGYKNFTKNLYVYLDDGKDLYIKQGTSKVLNVDKLYISIQIKYSINLEKFKIKE